MKKALLISLLVFVGLIAFIAMTFGGIYNQLVAKDEGFKSAWAQVENVYQRRLDLIPNLVETVKGYATHERETLQNVIEARSKISQIHVTSDMLNQPEALAKFQAAQGALSSTLSRLLVVAEQYPDLKANKNFLELQAQLEGTENRISVERKRFNEVAQEFNTFRRVFPNIIVANFMNFPEKAYFKEDEGASKVPQVKF